jgi:hypothetical protein
MKVVIEIAGPRNESHTFKPLMRRLRGRWDTANVAQKDKAESLKAISTVHFIPGIHISLDVDKKTGVVFDPLAEPKDGGTPEGHAIWEKIKPIMSQYPSFFSPTKPWPQSVKENMSQDEIKTWLYEMARTVEAGYARVVSGELMSSEEARKLPGKRRKGALGKLHKPEDQRWTDRVEVPATTTRKEPAGSGGGK